ncbi:MAG: hypothetical protein M3Q71_19670 [Chloroflexota bacterium]|nr:hypothetical protein [Chloroflexota bacterium]
MYRVPLVPFLSLLLLLGGLPHPAVAQDRAADAAAAAVDLSRLEAEGGYDALYDRMHPDAQAVVPRQAVVGWYEAESAPLGPGVITVLSVSFVDWTWGVTGVTYPGTAEVTFSQPYADGTVTEGVLRLVESGGEWRWFFGRDRAFVDAQIARFGGEPEPDAPEDEAAPPATTEEPISGNTYTSPQFGYRVTWQAPWDPGATTSVPNDRDDFRLTAGDIYLEYRGLFTDLSEEEALQAYGEDRRLNTSGATIESVDAEEQASTTLLLRYTTATGIAMVETMTVRSLAPGEAVLLRTLSAPEDQNDPEAVPELVELVTEELTGGADDQPAKPTPTPGPDTTDCSDVERWWSETAERRREAQALMVLLGQVGPKSVQSPQTSASFGSRFGELAEQQRESSPPGAAEELNDLLISVFAELETAMNRFSEAGRDGYDLESDRSAVASGLQAYSRAVTDFARAAPYETLADRCADLAGSLPVERDSVAP